MIKGIILAGGSGTRLYPASAVLSKQLLPVFDKPMIYYPLSVLMLADIREILLISTALDIPRFQQLFKDGSDWGLNITYAIQKEPQGLAQAFHIGKKFIGKDRVALILGDNIFYGSDLTNYMQKAVKKKKGATIFAYHVNDPGRYGIVEFNAEGKPLRIVEKPKIPKSPYAVTGLYFYDNQVIDIAASLKPSKRGEYEITDINQRYLEMEQLDVIQMGRGMAWLDTGTFESLLDASEFIATIEKRQGVQIACLEEIAYQKGYIGKKQLLSYADAHNNSTYSDYLRSLVNP